MDHKAGVPQEGQADARPEAREAADRADAQVDAPADGLCRGAGFAPSA